MLSTKGQAKGQALIGEFFSIVIFPGIEHIWVNELCVHRRNILAAAGFEAVTPGLLINRALSELSWRHQT